MTRPRSLSPLQVAGAIAAAAFLFIIPALINGFPFIFVDTTDYIILTPRLYRSPFYQIFVFGTGLKHLIWGPIIGQAVLASAALWYLLRTSTPITIRSFLSLAALIAVFSSVPVFTGFVMPDIFTGLMFSGIFLLTCRWDRLAGIERLAIAALTLLAIAVHLSHLLMATGMVGLCAVTRLAGLRWSRWPGIGAGAAAVALSALAIVSYNAKVFGTASLSPAGSSFLMANLIEYGPAREELRQTCPQAGYRLCRYVDQLPATANGLLWLEGPFNSLGGFAGMKDESSRIVSATLAHRGGEVLAVSARNSGRALVSIWPATDIVHFPNEPKIARIVGGVYGPGAVRHFVGSLQERDAFPVMLLDGLTLVGLLVSLIAIGVLGLISVRAGRSGRLALPAFVLVAFVGDAITCATLSGVFDRYQSRISWLFVAAAVILVLQVRSAGEAPVETPVEPNRA